MLVQELLLHMRPLHVGSVWSYRCRRTVVVQYYHWRKLQTWRMNEVKWTHGRRTAFPCFPFTRPRCSERSFLISRSLFKLGKCYFRSHSKPCYLQLLIFSRNQIEGVNARARWSPVFVSTQQVRWHPNGGGWREERSKGTEETALQDSKGR